MSGGRHEYSIVLVSSQGSTNGNYEREKKGEVEDKEKNQRKRVVKKGEKEKRERKNKSEDKAF